MKKHTTTSWKGLWIKTYSGALIKSVLLCIVLWVLDHDGLHAQTTQYTRPTVWYGAAVAANTNFYGETTQRLNNNVTTPVPFHAGQGTGLYLAPLVEFHQSDSRFGIMLQAGYDNRRSSFYDQYDPLCNCTTGLSTNLSYISLEPNLRFSPLESSLYLFAGPRLGFNVAKSFTYKEGLNPDLPGQLIRPDVKEDWSNIKSTIFSVQVGAGFDIPLSTPGTRTQTILSPFVSFHPILGQQPRTNQSWTVNTVRAGAAIKFGTGVAIPVQTTQTYPPEVMQSNVLFSVTEHRNVPAERNVREFFPVSNYVFFDQGSTEIPDRYDLLNKGQVAAFKEDQLSVRVPKNLSGRSDRQMTVYYNGLNILGDRMVKLPASTITLVGSSELGVEDGRTMAESVKRYLVDIFGVGEARISTEGRIKPKLPSERPGATKDLDLLRQGDRRVSIESTSPALLMEFLSGPGAPLKPVEIQAKQENPLDGFVTFNANGASKEFTSWSLAITDEKGVVQNFGPYTQDKISLPGTTILGNRSEGQYKVVMTGKAKGGNTVTRNSSFHLVRSEALDGPESMRYSVLFEFDESQTIAMYDKYLTEVVTPRIPTNATVIIHGHTDIIGETEYNETLSLARANSVKTTIESALQRAGRKDVKFEVYGFGEDENRALFNNKFPEERFYNRTVIIDIIPRT